MKEQAKTGIALDATVAADAIFIDNRLDLGTKINAGRLLLTSRKENHQKNSENLP